MEAGFSQIQSHIMYKIIIGKLYTEILKNVTFKVSVHSQKLQNLFPSKIFCYTEVAIYVVPSKRYSLNNYMYMKLAY